MFNLKYVQAHNLQCWGYLKGARTHTYAHTHKHTNQYALLCALQCQVNGDVRWVITSETERNWCW